MTAQKKNYRVKEFRPGLFRVMDGSTPIYDQSQDGDDKPLVFRDADFADECARELVRNEGATEKQAGEARS